MKVLHIIDHLGLGGAQNMLLDLLETRGSNIDISICSLKNYVLPLSHNRIKTANATYQTLGITKFNPLGAFKIRSVVKKENPDILHTHLNYSSLLGTIAAVSLGKSRPMIIEHIHSDPLYNLSRFQRFWRKIVAPNVSAHIAVSPSTQKATISAFQERARNVKLIPSGINLDAFKKSRADLDRVENFRRGASRLVGTVGRLARVKAIHLLLEAMPHLLKDDPGTRMLIVGDGPLLKELKNYARKFDIMDSVSFAGYQSDMVSVYHALDVLVLPSFSEGFPLTMLEAMAVGTPIVASDVGGMKDVVKDGETGLLVPYGNSNKLSDAILKIFKQESLRQRLISNSSNFVVQSFSRERMTKQLELIYNELMSRKY